MYTSGTTGRSKGAVWWSEYVILRSLRAVRYMGYTKITEKNFIIKAPQSKVWNSLGPALLNSPIGFEKIEVLDEYHVCAEAHIRIAFVPLTIRLMVVFLELDEPQRMVVALNAKVLKGLFRLNQRITFELNSRSDKHTEVRCESLAEVNHPILYRMIAKKVRALVEMTLINIEGTLRRIT